MRETACLDGKLERGLVNHATVGLFRARCVALVAACTFAIVPALPAQTFETLYVFQCGMDGESPIGGLVRDVEGNLYGTTFQGGTNNGGTVFKIDASGQEVVLHSFTDDGGFPEGNLIRNAKGDLYGTTNIGGAYGYGVVFKLRTTGKAIVLHDFTGGADGANPVGGLVRDSGGNLYGTTSYGGTYGKGTVYKLDPQRVETVLYSFAGGPDGASPAAGLIRAGNGTLYGTTFGGDGNYYGTIFKVTASGTEKLLHRFSGGIYGENPQAPLLRDADGNLYGTTFSGGTYNSGTIFEKVKGGKTKILYSFKGGADGVAPMGALVRDMSGNLYGTTAFGGTFGLGTVFRLDANGNETVLHSFAGGADGDEPYGGLIQDSNGTLYGTTTGFGDFPPSECGTVFKLTP